MPKNFHEQFWGYYYTPLSLPCQPFVTKLLQLATTQTGQGFTLTDEHELSIFLYDEHACSNVKKCNKHKTKGLQFYLIRGII